VRAATSKLQHHEAAVPTTQRPQYTWGDCGEQCPSGWTTVWRQDGDGASHGRELMTDNSKCPSGTQRLLCCPPGLPEGFKCGWWTHYNGKCYGSCPAGYTEVGSNSDHCHNSCGTGRHQAACTAMDPMTYLQAQCYWHGNQDGCSGRCSSACNHFFLRRKRCGQLLPVQPVWGSLPRPERVLLPRPDRRFQAHKLLHPV
jgi:hypothetical protein